MIATRCFPQRTLLRAAARCSHRSLQRNVFSKTATETQKLTLAAQSSSEVTPAGNISTSQISPRAGGVQELDVALLVSVLKQENASDICVIRVPPELKYTNHMIIVSGSSPRHLSAIAALLLKTFKFLRKDKDPHVRLEGRDCDDWKCIDFGPMVLHLMLPDTRQTYELEKLWTLRSYDEQLKRIPPETLPSDFIYDVRPAAHRLKSTVTLNIKQGQVV
ncbi:mitochondrial assembly of ribosomal large subunit protein 1 [Carassius gibelio]|uniref:mitochondrial assembly of ribosomal large subunit protein 1 n=1 Tax=Carassius gibelio TaxID=101364 RepID=UPI002279B4DD|nr:mitochondrial assembly of ribosomal large subunit protein 1 [Carassius gibelio]